MDSTRLSIQGLLPYFHLWLQYARPPTLSLPFVDVGYVGRVRADLFHKLGLTSCLSTSHFCTLRPLTLDSTLAVAKYASRFRADFPCKCNLTSCHKYNYSF